MPNIIKYPLPDGQYRKEVYVKKQAYLHHTVSGGGAEGDIDYWKNTPDRVATTVVIERDGDIYECFDHKFCAPHLGITKDLTKKYGSKAVPDPNELLTRHSLGIELDSWGGLIKNDKGLWVVPKWDKELKKNIPTNTIIPNQNVIEYPNGYRGWKGFEKYTDSQIASAKYLLELWCKEFGISKTYNPDIWDICKRAYNLESGIFTHVSVRPDKSDLHPQKEIITMLQTLK